MSLNINITNDVGVRSRCNKSTILGSSGQTHHSEVKLVADRGRCVPQSHI